LALLLDLVLRPLVVALLGGGPWPWSAERLLVAAGGMRATLPVALSFVLLEQVPRLHRVAALDAEALASDLEALVFVVVVASLLLKGVLLPRLLERVLRPQPQRAEVPLGPHQ
jgi:NhaP-type Na+/H+ or K+/H+ antiporter